MKNMSKSNNKLQESLQYKCHQERTNQINLSFKVILNKMEIQIEK
jgi:hypothetical protein